MLLITKVARSSSFEPHLRASAATALVKKSQALIVKLHDNGIDIAAADQATQARYEAIDTHRPILHPACALWFAQQCLARGDKALFCEVVTTFRVKRLQGIVQHPEIVAEGLNDLPWVHQLEFAPGCTVTEACINALRLALSQRRGATPFELNLHGCTIDSSVLKTLAIALSEMKALAMLSISKPAISGDEPCGVALGQAIADSPHLLGFKLVLPATTQETAEAIGKGIRENASLIEVHFCTDDSIESPQWMMAELARPEAVDPSRPGRAAAALQTLVVCGYGGKNKYNPLKFPERCTKDLVAIVNSHPSLTRVRIHPWMQFHDLQTCRDLFDICDARPLCLDIQLVFNSPFSGPYPWSKDTDPFDIGTQKPFRPTLNFLRRTSPSPLLRQELEPGATVAILHASLPEARLVPELWQLVADHVSDDRSLLALRCISKPALKGSRRFHRAFQVELVTCRPHAFGDIEFAHHMMGPPLAGLPMNNSRKRKLQSMIDTQRPDAARLHALMDSEGQRMLDNWKEQELLLTNYSFVKQLNGDHAQLKAFRKLFPDLKGSPGDISMKHLSFEVGLLTKEKEVKRSIAKAAKRVPKLLSSVPKLLSPRRKDNDPSAPPEKND